MLSSVSVVYQESLLPWLSGVISMETQDASARAAESMIINFFMMSRF